MHTPTNSRARTEFEMRAFNIITMIYNTNCMEIVLHLHALRGMPVTLTLFKGYDIGDLIPFHIQHVHLITKNNKETLYF